MTSRARTEHRTDARRIATRDAGPLICRCTRRNGYGPDRTLVQTGPTLVATFRNGDLVELVRRHHCGRPAEHLDPATWSR